jgi:hypothetical protein
MHPNRTLFETYAQPPADSRLLICNPHDVQYVASLTETAAQVDIFPREWSMLQHLRARIGGRTNVTIHETIFPTGE